MLQDAPGLAMTPKAFALPGSRSLPKSTLGPFPFPVFCFCWFSVFGFPSWGCYFFGVSQGGGSPKGRDGVEGKPTERLRTIDASCDHPKSAGSSRSPSPPAAAPPPLNAEEKKPDSGSLRRPASATARAARWAEAHFGFLNRVDPPPPKGGCL